MHPLNRNLRAGDRRYRLLARAILNLGAERSLSDEQALVVSMDTLVGTVGRLQAEGIGRGSMDANRIAHLLSELGCRSERVKDSDSGLPVTICHVPGTVRNSLQELMDAGMWLWKREKRTRSPPPPKKALTIEAWEGRLQELRMRLRREPTQAEMLAAWRGLYDRDMVCATQFE